MELTDFLGHTYGPGDLVIYAAMSGRCVNMIVGRIVEIYRVAYVDFKWERLADDAPVPRKTNWKDEDIGEEDSGLRVKIQPLRGARWEQHHGHKYYVDTRSDKRIDPWKGKGYPHIKIMGHYIDTRSGGPIGDSQRYQHWAREKGLPYIPSEFVDYVHTEFQPWVEERNDGVKPVTLTVTDNIVKWEGELPDAGVSVQVP
jgi:hypothetical protein